MKLTIFRSAQGDCLLASDTKKNHILIDGGMAASYTTHVATSLGKLRKKKESLGLIYVSHIDQDHISGVLQLLDDLVEWRVHDFQTKNGNPSHPKPDAVRPPDVKATWHNAFHEQIGKNAGAIQSALAVMATILRGHSHPDVLAAADEYDKLATSEKQAVLVSRRIGGKQLNIPLNSDFGGSLIYVTDPATTVTIGEMKLTIIGPYAEDLAALRKKWNKWLKTAQNTLKSIRRQSERDEERIGASEVNLLVGPLLAQAKTLGKRSVVTPANLASIMVLLESKGKSVLLTGDGHWEDILAGLENAGKLDGNGGLHVDVLKVPHHGSEHNTHPDFAKAITAKRYVYCGDGSHTNPELDVISAYANSRIGTPNQKSGNAEADRKFEMIFNTKSSLESGKDKTHMKKVELLAKKLAKKSKGKMKIRFLGKSSLTFTV